MKRSIIAVVLMIALSGCQPVAQQTSEPQGNTQQEVAKKLFAQGMLALHNQDIKGAIENLQASINADPSDPNPYLVMGEILIKAQQYDKAVDLMEQTVKNFPNNGVAFYMLAVSNKMTNKVLPAVLAARRSYELCKADKDVEMAKTSAILLEELIKSAQDQQGAQAVVSKVEDKMKK